MPKETKQGDEDLIIYTTEELENFPSQTDASYFEKAQDFTKEFKMLRISHLNLKQQEIITTIGGKDYREVVYVGKRTGNGVNYKGIEETLQFLSDRLDKHTTLMDWTEQRMLRVLDDDMETWFDMMLQKYEEFGLEDETFSKLRVLVQDKLETAYRRAIGNKERSVMRPAGSEVMRRAAAQQGLLPPSYEQGQQQQQISYENQGRGL
jgi:hypothetical protein